MKKKPSDPPEFSFEEFLSQQQELIHQLETWHSQVVPHRFDLIPGAQVSFRLMAGNQGGEYFEFWREPESSRWALFFSSVANFEDSTKILIRLMSHTSRTVETLFFQDPVGFAEIWKEWMIQDGIKNYGLGLCYWDVKKSRLHLFSTGYPKILILTPQQVEQVAPMDYERFRQGELLPHEHWVGFFGRGWSEMNGDLLSESLTEWVQFPSRMEIHQVRHFFFERAFHQLPLGNLHFDLSLVVLRIDQPRVQLVTSLP